MDVLEIKNLSKSFGALKIIDHLNFCVPEHAVFGFVGKNGAGKTTTMKMIIGLLKPDKGEITVCGEKVRYGYTKTNRNIGYLPDVPEFYGYMTPKEYLRLCGRISQISTAQLESKILSLLAVVGLDGINRRIQGFSRGMKQRLGIAQALLNEPRLLICDEPTSALDPVGRREILDILHVVKRDTTVIFSTHILSDVERICDSVGVLNDGKLVLSGSISALKGEYREEKVIVEIDRMEKALLEKIGRLEFVTEVKANGNEIVISLYDIPHNSSRLLTFFAQEEYLVLKYEIAEPSIEQLFLHAVQERNE